MGTPDLSKIEEGKAIIADPDTPPELKAKVAAKLESMMGGAPLDVKVTPSVPKIPADATKPSSEAAKPEAPASGSLQERLAANKKAYEDALKQKPSAEKMSSLEVAGRGAAHYQSLGLADEMAGIGSLLASDESANARRVESQRSDAALHGAEFPDERFGEATGRVTRRGLDAPAMSAADLRDQIFESGRKAYDEGDARAREQNPLLFHGAGIGSTLATGAMLPGMPVGELGLAGRSALAAGTGATMGTIAGAAGAEPGHRMEGAREGGTAGMLMGPVAEVGVSGARALGKGAMKMLRHNPDMQLAEGGGAEVGVIKGLKPGEAIQANRDEAIARGGGLTGGDVGAEKAAGPALEAVNTKLGETYGPVSEAQKAYFASPEGQATVPATEVYDAALGALERYRGSDGKPLPGAKLAELKKIAADTLEHTAEGNVPRELNAEDLTKMSRIFRDKAALDTYDPGIKGAFTDLSKTVQGVVAERYPGLAKINTEASHSFRQVKGGVKALGFDENASRLETTPNVAPAADTGSDFLKMAKAIASEAPDKQKALRTLLEHAPEDVRRLVREAQGTAAFERLRGQGAREYMSVGMHGPRMHMGFSGREIGTRAAALKDIPAGAGAKIGAVTSADIAALEQMLGLGDKMEAERVGQQGGAL